MFVFIRLENFPIYRKVIYPALINIQHRKSCNICCWRLQLHMKGSLLDKPCIRKIFFDWECIGLHIFYKIVQEVPYMSCIILYLINNRDSYRDKACTFLLYSSSLGVKWIELSWDWHSKECLLYRENNFSHQTCQYSYQNGSKDSQIQW